MVIIEAHIAAGTVVIGQRGERFVYDGPADMVSESYSLLHGGMPHVEGPARQFIPADAAPDAPNLRDPRIVVANDRAGSPGAWAGAWRAHVDGIEVSPRWSKTRREAVLRAAWRAAIADYWIARLGEDVAR